MYINGYKWNFWYNLENSCELGKKAQCVKVTVTCSIFYYIMTKIPSTFQRKTDICNVLIMNRMKNI